jgi:predicted DNA-binding protein YlxM (UPF0122 family)
VSVRGKWNGQTVLSEEQVTLIRQLYLDGRHSMNDLAADFHVTKSTIQAVLDCTNWRWLLDRGEAEALADMRAQRCNHKRRERKPDMDVRYKGPTEAERIAARLRNSGDHRHADTVDQRGSSPLRHFTNVHHSYNKDWGPGDESPEAEEHKGGE